MSAPAPRPTLFMIAGPNGAGKTTFYETALKSRINAPFLNADIIQRDELCDISMQASYAAAKIAADRRDKCLKLGESCVTETVFSHPSKLELLAEARKAGFRVIFFHFHVVSAELSVRRVAERVKEGGHPVPEEKIRDRYERNQTLIRQGVSLADQAMIYDSSALNQSPTLLARVRAGRFTPVIEAPPDWFVRLYGEDL